MTQEIIQSTEAPYHLDREGTIAALSGKGIQVYLDAWSEYVDESVLERLAELADKQGFEIESIIRMKE